ncbi:hypothetical protein DRQ26_06070, partial [bacterium]
ITDFCLILILEFYVFVRKLASETSNPHLNIVIGGCFYRVNLHRYFAVIVHSRIVSFAIIVSISRAEQFETAFTCPGGI